MNKEGVAKSRGGRCAYLCIYYACAFTYHLPLRVLLLPEGGESRYHRLVNYH